MREVWATRGAASRHWENRLARAVGRAKAATGMALVAVSCAVGTGCGSGGGTGSGESTEAVASTAEACKATPPRGDSPSAPPVVLSWGPEFGPSAIRKSTPIEVTVTNLRNEQVTVEVSLRGGGLDQRVAAASVGVYSLEPGEVRSVPIGLSDLPIQSLGAPGLIELTATCSGASWTGIRAAPKPLYVQFAPGYSAIYASTKSTWATTALGLVCGDTENPDYTTLLAHPDQFLNKLLFYPRGLSPGTRSCLGLDDSAGGSWYCSTGGNLAAQKFYARLTGPLIHPSGRYRASEGGLVDVPATATGGSMVPVEQTLFDISARVAPFVVSIPPALYIPRPTKVCAKWDAWYIDAGFGEDYLNVAAGQSYPARYASVEVRGETWPGTWWVGYLDADGCTPQLSLLQGSYFLRLKPDFKLNLAEFHIINDQSNPASTWALAFNVTGDSPDPTLVALGGASGTAAVVALLLSNWDSGIVPGTCRVTLSEGNCMNEGAYGQAGDVCIGNEPNYPYTYTGAYKYVIAHELGHAIDQAASGFPSYSYARDESSLPDSCCCKHVQGANGIHCLQSWQLSSPAMMEGFAYMYSAKVFNEWRDADCMLAYGKEFREDNGNVLRPPVPIDCRNPRKWMKTHCDIQEYHGVPTHAGVELDWVTFFWNVHAPQEYGDKRISMDDYFRIKRTACTGNQMQRCAGTETLYWGKLRDGAFTYFGKDDQNIKYRHMLKMADDHGVYSKSVDEGP